MNGDGNAPAQRITRWVNPKFKLTQVRNRDTGFLGSDSVREHFTSVEHHIQAYACLHKIGTPGVNNTASLEVVHVERDPKFKAGLETETTRETCRVGGVTGGREVMLCGEPVPRA